MKVLDLFSGIGGFSLGLERAGFETVAFCEIEEFPRKVLAKHWPDVPCYEDVRELTGERLKADGISVDLICGGYPCQPFSSAGKRGGENDDRHLWPEVARLISEIHPDFCLFENVAGHITLGLDQVLSDLEGLGYTSEAFVIPACAVNAVHRRDRVWIIAHSDNAGNSASRRGANGNGAQEVKGRENESQPQSVGHNEDAAYSSSIRQQGQGQSEQSIGAEAHSDWEAGFTGSICEQRVRETEPIICGGNDGVSRKLDRHRLKALGNAVVPQIPEIIGRAIMEMDNAAGN